jgi:hypothetical protein
MFRTSRDELRSGLEPYTFFVIGWGIVSLYFFKDGKVMFGLWKGFSKTEYSA